MVHKQNAVPLIDVSAGRYLIMVMMMERGVKEGLMIWSGTWIVAFGLGGIVSHIVM